MAKVTAKVRCNVKQTYGEGDERQATVGFCADYADGANKEWARYTPYLDLRMGLVGPVGDLFDVGNSYTLTFETED